jgi:hypothetical protein
MNMCIYVYTQIYVFIREYLYVRMYLFVNAIGSLLLASVDIER